MGTQDISVNPAHLPLSGLSSDLAVSAPLISWRGRMLHEYFTEFSQKKKSFILPSLVVDGRWSVYRFVFMFAQNKYVIEALTIKGIDFDEQSKQLTTVM